MPPTDRRNDAPTTRFLRGIAPWCCALLALSTCTPARSAELSVWEHSPYRVLVNVAVDDATRSHPGLEEAIAQSLVDRVEGAIRPLWDMKLTVAADGADRRQCFALNDVAWDSLSAEQTASDKLMWLAVKVMADGYDLRCREFDVYLRRWGPIRSRFVQQASYLPEACLQLLATSFSPLAIIAPIEENDAEVQLIFRGSRLPRPSREDPFVASGEAFLPLLRRTDRTGKLVENGVSPLPWTLLTAEAPSDGGWLAAVHSGVRRPFAMARRGLVEQVAIGLRNPDGPTRVRFHSRASESQGLAGYEVFRSSSEGDNELLGVTDRDGIIEIPSNGSAVSTIVLRSDGQVLARVPLPAGNDELLQAPIADDVTRLQAQAEAQVVREELIDLVARRAIMMGRVKSMLKNGRIDDAKALMAELDALPSPSVFSRTIDNAARRIPASQDPSVQKRIDALYSSTREMLSKFLGTRPITDLQNEVNAAVVGGVPTSSEVEEEAAAAAVPTS